MTKATGRRTERREARRAAPELATPHRGANSDSALLHRLCRSMPGMMSVTDEDGIVLAVSDRWLKLMGYTRDEVIGTSRHRFFSTRQLDQLSNAVLPVLEANGQIDGVETELTRKDGSILPVLVSSKNETDAITGRRYTLTVSIDLTEFRRMEAQLNDARRLEAIGALAGGIAHDFNNILGAVLGFSKFLVDDLDPATPQHTYAERIATASERGRDLIGQVFAFSRAGRVERKSEDVAALVAETASALPALMPRNAGLSVAIAHRPLMARVNAAQMQQIVLNLAVNAYEALRGEPGRVRVELEEIRAGTLDFQRVLSSAGHGVHATHDGDHEIVLGCLEPAARCARINVTDNGAGMLPETMAKAFEPFFTTKSRATGTGLGLATVRNIVAASGGCCIMRSAIGNGTTVTVCLPLIDTDPTADARPPASSADRSSGQGQVIVVDEDQDVADAMAIGLRRMGYHSVAYNDPKMALQCFEERPEDWKFVVSDQVMPGMTGLELLAAMKRVRPSIGFILCSGYSDETVEQAALAEGVSRFLLKPVDAEELAEAIKGVPS